MAEAFVRTIKRDYARVSSRPNAESGIRPRKAHVAQLNQLARTVPVIRGEPVARVIESPVFVLRRFGTEKRIKEMYSPMDDGTWPAARRSWARCGSISIHQPIPDVASAVRRPAVNE